MQQGPVHFDNSSVIEAISTAFKQVTPQVVQDGVNTILESAQQTVTTENAQSLLSSLLESGSDALGSVCEAVSDNPITAGFTIAAGVSTLVGGLLYRNHLQNKAAEAKKGNKDDKKDNKSDAGNDSTIDAANGSPVPGEDTSQPGSSTDHPEPRRSASTSPKLKRSSSGSGHHSE